MRRLVFIAITVVLLAGCVHHTPFKDEYYFQALGEDGSVVATADLDKVRESSFSSLLPASGALDYALKRSERLSLSLSPKRTDIYPLSLDEYTKSGALEGNLSKTIINSALGFSKEFDKVKEDKLKYYSNGTLSMALPKNGILLFSDGSYKELYDKTILEREKLIPDDIASFMADAMFALFINSPETLLDIGFELPQSVIQEIDISYLGFSESDASLLLSGTLIMKSTSSARALTTLLKNQLIQDAKRSGEKVDIKQLSTYFNYKETTVTIESFALKGDMANKAKDTLTNALEGLV